MIKLPTDDMVEAARFTLSGICGFEVTAQTVRKALESALAVAPAPAEHVVGADRLIEAAKDMIASASDTYKKRNGHVGSFEDDSGEKCWIVPFDAFENLRSATAALSSPMGGGE